MDVTPPESDTDRKEEKYEMEEAGEANGQIKINSDIETVEEK